MCLSIEAHRRVIKAVEKKYRDDGTGFDPPVPQDLTGWISETVPRLRAELSDACLPRTPCWTFKEIAALIVAWVYGPREAGPPPDHVLAEIRDLARFTDPIDQRAVERVLVYGLRPEPHGHPPPRPPDPWDRRWPFAEEALKTLVRGTIRESVGWLCHHIVTRQGVRNGHVRAEAELTTSTRDVVRALLGWCGCLANGGHLGWDVESVNGNQVALDRCQTRHSLCSWDGEEELDDFIHRAALNGIVNGDTVQAGGFRFGILASGFFGAELRCGHILRCPPGLTGEAGHFGEIRPEDNRCSNPQCGELSQVLDPSFWLWLDGDRVRAEAWRCAQHGFLFFRDLAGSPCPLPVQAGGQHGWNPRPITTIWIEPCHAHPERLDHAPGPPNDPALEAIARERWEACLDRIDSIANPDERGLAESLFRERRSAWAAADRHGFTIDSRKFLDLLERCMGHFRDLLPPDFSNRFDTELGRDIAKNLLDGVPRKAAAKAREIRIDNPGFREESAIVLVRAAAFLRGVEPADDPAAQPTDPTSGDDNDE